MAKIFNYTVEFSGDRRSVARQGDPDSNFGSCRVPPQSLNVQAIGHQQVTRHLVDLLMRSQLQIDHDAAHRTRLASEDMTVLHVVGGEAIGTILLDRAFEKRDLASTALTGAA